LSGEEHENTAGHFDPVKLFGSFALVLVVTVALGVFAVERLARVDAGAAEIRDNRLVATGALGSFAETTIRYRQLEQPIFSRAPRKRRTRKRR
jgi:hypothetical protein